MKSGFRDFETATASMTAQAIKSGQVSALEACDAAIDRIERFDVSINAIVVRDFDRARDMAKGLDAEGVKGDQRPLLGVPMTVKESHNVAGLPSSWGMPAFEDAIADTDSVAVERLKSAGAIILGKSNPSMALADWQAVNPIYGRTLNPHNHDLSPGGSSGGAAAALAAGMVPLELGSDVGGSIRIPAHMCGVYGHKPTFGIVPFTGHAFPGTDTVDPDLAVIGPMARSAADLAVALGVIAGPIAGSGYGLALPATRHKALKDFRVLVLDHHPVIATADEVLQPLRKLANDLDHAGVDVAYNLENLPDLADAHAHYRTMLLTQMTRGVPGSQPIDAHQWMDLRDRQMQITRQWSEVFQEVDVVISPPFGVTAFPHTDNPDWSTRTLMIDGKETPYGPQVAWPGIATFSGLPATVAPLAKTSAGLPVGVQIMGALFDDYTTIGFADLLAREGLHG